MRERIASDLVGVAYKEEKTVEAKESFIDRFSKALFKKKSEK